MQLAGHADHVMIAKECAAAAASRLACALPLAVVLLLKSKQRQMLHSAHAGAATR
jgi:hypothetical protein